MSACKRRPIAALGVALLVSLGPGCHDSTAPPGGGVPSFNHVFIVVEENNDYTSVIGSSSMPYLNGLAQQYGLATQYYADTHPSIGNYFMMTVGKIISNDDNYSSVVTDDNVVRRLLAAGKTWKSYAEDLPSVGYAGGGMGDYARKDKVIALLSGGGNDPGEKKRLVPLPQITTGPGDRPVPGDPLILSDA